MMLPVLRTCSKASPAASASRPARYPTELIDVWLTVVGERTTLRPILAQDEPGLRALFRRSSAAARCVIDEFPRVLDGMCDPDFAQQLAVVITVHRAGAERIVADARYVVCEGGGSAELAVFVEDRWQRQGLGRRALTALVGAAQRSRLQALHASVRRNNAPMLLLLHRCGFTAAADADRAETGFVKMTRNVSVVRAGSEG